MARASKGPRIGRARAIAQRAKALRRQIPCTPPQSPSKPREWPSGKRHAVIKDIEAFERHKEQGQDTPTKNLKQIYRRHNVPERTVRQWRETGLIPHRTGRFRSGRPRLLTEKQLNEVEDYLFENGYFARTLPWQALCTELELPVKGRALKTAMNKRGFFKCKACQKKWLSKANVVKRYRFALWHYLNWTLDTWKMVVFTDETHFSVGQKNALWVIRRVRERTHPECVQFKTKLKSSCFHFWAAVGWNYKSDLICYSKVSKGGNMTQDQYEAKIFRPYILPLYEERCMNDEGFILEEDNDGGHGTRSKNNPIANLRRWTGFDCYSNSPQSPDFAAAIEKTWRTLKQRVKNRLCRTEEELFGVIYEEWAKITQNEINQWILDMPEIMRTAWKNKGLHTPW